MKANAPKRKIFNDAVDLLTADLPAEQGKSAGVEMLPVEKIRPFHDHPFRLYEGDRLDDMAASVREHGVLNPVIVQKKADGYEMLSGHNRLNAAKLAGITEIPAIVKEGLTEEEAYVYVIETNLMQRSFADLLPSERATVLSERYARISSQGRRNDIRRELAILNGKDVDATCGHGVHKLKSRDGIGEEYGMTGRNIARYMRVNQLIEPMKLLLDKGELTLRAAVELSYLDEVEQGRVLEQMEWSDVRIKEDKAKVLRENAGELDDEKLTEILHPASEKKISDMVSVKLPARVNEKYFSGMKTREKSEIIMRALEAWFDGEERDCLVQRN